MTRSLFKNKKAMSIVVSTIIIVAISITMAIAISFWAMGIGNSFTKFEKLEIQSAYADGPNNIVAVGGGSGATAVVQTVDVNGQVSTIRVTNGGSGYNIGARVTGIVSQSGGSGFLFSNFSPIVQVQNGAVVSITVTPGFGGRNYSPGDTVIISPRVSSQSVFVIYLRVKNTGSAAATINNVFIDGKPYDGVNVNAIQYNLVASTLPVGATIGARNTAYIYLPNGGTWNSGDYVEVELETVAGRLYSTTVVLP